jgi:hypothetical protein
MHRSRRFCAGLIFAAPPAPSVVNDITSCLAGVTASRKLLEDACGGGLARKVQQWFFAALHYDNEKKTAPVDWGRFVGCSESLLLVECNGDQ